MKNSFHIQLSNYKLLSKYVVYIFLSAIVLGLVTTLLVKLEVLEPLSRYELFNTDKGPFLLFISTLILSPIIEEILFRLPLVYSPKNISLSISLLISIILAKLNYFDDKYFRLSIAVTFGILLFLALKNILNKNESVSLRMKAFWSKNSKFIFYFSLILFALIHLSNFKALSNHQLLFTPLLVGPQLVTGYFLANIRLSHGLLWSIQLHMIINVFAYLGSMAT